MDESQIKQSLEEFFEKNRIVLWYDDNAEFADSLPEIDGVKVLNLKETPHFKVRVTMDVDEPEQKFLLYAPYSKPTDVKKDWFIDVSKYAICFKADKSSVILNNLGLANRQELLSYFSSKLKFFKSNARFDKFKAILLPGDEEKDMDLKIVSILAKSDKADISSILISMLSAWVSDEEFSLDVDPACFNDIVKMDMAKPFWKLIADQFGYEPEKPTLRDFVLRLFASDLLFQLNKDQYPTAIKGLMLPSMHNAYICLNQWRESNRYYEFYDILSSKVAEELSINNWIGVLPLELLLKIKTFQQVERRIIMDMKDYVLHAVEITDNKKLVSDIKVRLDGYWASKTLRDTKVASRSLFNRLYDAILNVSNLTIATNNIQPLLQADDFDTVYTLYTKELYKIDTLYRKAIEAIQYVTGKGIEVLKDLQTYAENIYNNKYIENLGIKVNKTINFALAQNWKVRDAYNQYDFFAKYVRPLLEKDKKVFVIISDGLRYEVASELADMINSQYRMKAELDSMLGVLPSYTALGMAALLPHKKLNYNDKGEVVIDDKPTMSLEQRKVFLEPYNGTAIKMEDLFNLGREGGREFVKSYNLIYIYHNLIDATGDALKTEENTFNAVTESLSRTRDMIAHLINNLSANNIFVTADHGFLFQYSKPNEINRSAVDESFENAYISKKRYVLGRDIEKSENSIHSTTDITAGTVDPIVFNLPKGPSLYNFIGGSRFVHGGAMPQECVVPLLQIRQLKSEKSRETTRLRDVEVSLLGNLQRFTNKIQKFQLVQTEPVSDRNRAVTLKVGVFEGDEPVTNIETVTFDSKSNSMDDRYKTVTLTLVNRSYNKDNPYSLRLIKENGVVAQDVNIKIDLVYDNDF